MGRFLYFAYGSNLYLPRLRYRTPSCRPLGRAQLTHHTLRFHKLGLDGSGKADALYTGRYCHRVLGVVYSISVLDRPRLDAAESLGLGYDRFRVWVRMGHRRLRVETYRAREESIETGLLPMQWYLECLRQGALEHGLSAAYLQKLSRVSCTPTLRNRSPDAGRSPFVVHPTRDRL